MSDTITPYIEKAIAFMEQQAPDVLQELVMRAYVFSCFWFVICLIILILLAFGIKEMYKEIKQENKKPYYERQDLDGPMFLAFFVFVAILTPFSLNAYSLINAHWFPKLFMLEALRGFIK